MKRQLWRVTLAPLNREKTSVTADGLAVGTSMFGLASATPIPRHERHHTSGACVALLERGELTSQDKVSLQVRAYKKLLRKHNLNEKQDPYVTIQLGMAQAAALAEGIIDTCGYYKDTSFVWTAQVITDGQWESFVVEPKRSCSGVNLCKSASVLSSILICLGMAGVPVMLYSSRSSDSISQYPGTDNPETIFEMSCEKGGSESAAVNCFTGANASIPQIACDDAKVMHAWNKLDDYGCCTLLSAVAFSANLEKGCQEEFLSPIEYILAAAILLAAAVIVPILILQLWKSKCCQKHHTIELPIERSLTNSVFGTPGNPETSAWNEQDSLLDLSLDI